MLRKLKQVRHLEDLFQRPLQSLRISVTDRCNLRCQYCMPEAEYVWLPRTNILSFEEISRLVGVFTEVGVNKVRLTGGEPLIRKNLPQLVEMLSSQPGVEELALTTNGLLLKAVAKKLKDAGLSRITVSLDTLLRERFSQLTRRDQLKDVLDGINTAREVGFQQIKLDTVIIRGTNEDEIPSLIEYGRMIGAEVRFIEYMDVGGATRWSEDQVYGQKEILDTIAKNFGESIEQIDIGSTAPAKRFRLKDGTVFGIIASMTEPFCGTCDRSRLTADGLWYLCLYAQKGFDLRGPLRSGASNDELKTMIVNSWSNRNDRGAEELLQLEDRNAVIAANRLRKDPHLEMHTRGG